MILCIDTCTEHAGVALVQKTRAVYKPLPQGRYAESLLAIIDKVFKSAKAKPADLTGVLVIKGPGSFTSLRVGIAVANQFAHQLKIPIVGLRTDEWWLCRTDERPVVYLQSMNREEVYVSATGITSFIQKVENVYKMYTKITFFGQLSGEHRAKLSTDWNEAFPLGTIEEAWVTAAQLMTKKSHKTYELVEPFYGKEPTITKSKHYSTKICLSK